MSHVPNAELIAEANSWRDEDPHADSTEQVSEEVTSLIARLTDALEFVTDNYVLKSWGGLFEILNEAYPEDVFLTLPNNESRDSGPRIISLIRLLDRERTRAEVAESRLEAATVATDDHEPIKILRDKTFVAWQDVLTVTSESVDTKPTNGGNDRDGGLSESEREALAQTIAAWQGRHAQPKTLPSSIALADAILARFRLPVPVEPETPERFPESPHVEAKYWAELVRARRRIAELEAVEPEWGTEIRDEEGNLTDRDVHPDEATARSCALYFGDMLIRREVTPWLPVEPVWVDPQPHDSREDDR